MVYFTRSPEPPSSPATAATKGSSGLSTPLTGSGSPGTQPRSLSPTGFPSPAVSVRRNGALTPSILDSQSNSASVGNGLSSLHDGLLRDTILRRAAQHFPGGSLNFERFETDKIEECVEFIRSLIERSAEANEVSIEEMRKGVKIMATGGGAHKFYELFSGSLGVEVLREDEMECLIEGLKFITLIPDEVYYFSDELIHTVSHPSCSSERPGPETPRYAVTFEGEHMAQLPCLLVNIGSGVSIIRVDEDGTFERVSGTSLGGGTLWGLLSLLTPATSFDGEWRGVARWPHNKLTLGAEMLALSERGTNASVDMLVGDIYGQDYSKLGLKSTMIASSFGKVFQRGRGRREFKAEDMSRSLLYAISNNIGQIA